MPGKLIEAFEIPATYGKGFIVKKGQVFRIHQVTGRQVGDCAFFNANDPKEMFHCGQSWAINVIAGTGTSKSFKYFYSKPPRENVMMTVLQDTYANHWGNMGGRCSSRLYEIRDNLPIGTHRSCQENLREAVEPFGLTGDDIIDVFNVFMNVDLQPDGGFQIKPTEVGIDDFIEMRAEMDILAAISACPADTSPTNGGKSAPLGIQIFEG
jgi:uncharacterized protein YcgI (DUF1989 family)